ncbi:MAG: ATP-binding protein, partial [bacterium]
KKFSRGRGGKRLNVNSTGLGLYIAKNIVELHNGSIDVYSEGKDKGSVFTISLPLMQKI